MSTSPKATASRFSKVSGESFRRLLESNPEAMFVVKGDGRIDLLNTELARLFGYTHGELLGQPVEILVPEHQRTQHVAHRRMFMNAPAIRAMAADREFRCRRQDGSEFPAHVNLFPLNQRGWTVCTVRDLTQFKRAAAVLYESEEQFWGIFDNAPFAISLKDVEGCYYRVNRHFEILTGKSGDSIKGKTPLEIFDEAFATTGLEHDQEVLVTGRSSEREAAFQGEDGSRTLLTVKFPIKDQDDRVTAIGVIHTDITERKLAEDAIHALAAGLERAREAERTAVARDIHDDLGQMLTGLKLDLDWLAERLPGTAGEVHERIHAMDALIDNGIDSVRRIASSLRPAMLDDLGLAAAVEWMAREFGKRSGIRCVLTLAEVASTGSVECDTAVFRVFEEALTNVARHARANRVDVTLASAENALELEVCDDGVGIGTKALRNPRSVGLSSMRERAAGWNGTLVVEPGAAGGTRVRLHMPRIEGGNGGGETR